MKKTLLAILSIAAFSNSAYSAVLIAASIDRGFVLSNGTTAVTSGTIRFGSFASGTNFATASESQLETAFTQIVTTTGPWTYGGNPGQFEFTGDENAALNYTGGTTLYEGLQYDATAGIDLTNSTDLAGNKVYLWVTSGAEHAILSESFWQDAQNFDTTTFFDTNTATIDLGSISSTTLAGTVGPAIRLQTFAAVPEPSRAVLGLAGLGALFFRRRRA